MILIQRVSIALAFCLITIHGSSQDGAELYKRHCAACHSIGGGRLVGPDLAGVTKKADNVWLAKFIKNSTDMIKSGDPAAVAIGKEYNNLLMPPYNGSDNEVAAIIGFIDSKGGSAQSAAADTFLNAASVDHVARGRALFSGTVPLNNGGSSCITCHSVHDVAGIGGSLAKSLNLSYFMLKGPGIKAMLQAPPFPAMTNAYAAHPLKDQEIYDLSAYLKSISQKMIKGEARRTTFPFLLLGIGGWCLFVFLLFGLWRLRKRFSVNHAIFTRQLATEK